MPTVGTTNDDGTSVSFDVPSQLPDPTATTAEVKVLVPLQEEIVKSFPVEQPLITAAWRHSQDRIGVSATGWRGSEPSTDPAPQILVNGRWAAIDGAWRNDAANSPLQVTLPPAVVPEGELRIALVDDLQRRSPDYVLVAQT